MSEDTNKRCGLVIIKKDDNCPCKNCLVKVMCKEACEEFIEYTRRNKNKITILERQRKKYARILL